MATSDAMLMAPKYFRKKCGAGINEKKPKIAQKISGTQIQ
jgi:hypothetical protein